jgi:pteridine reductase
MPRSERPVALVTGAARRVGRCIVRTLHDAGYDIALHYRQAREEAEQLAAELGAKRADSVVLQAGDLADLDELPRLVLRCVQRFGRLDALVNNASSFYPTPIGEATAQQWEELFATNARAPLFLSQAAAPHLRAARGAIVNLVDIYAERPLARHTIYCMAKAANVMLVRSLARELGPEVRVNGVAPGAVLWPEGGKSAADQQELIGKSALRRAGTPEDVAGAVLYLLRDATFVTGQVVAVDGGRTLTI